VNTKWIAYARDRWVVTSVSITAGLAIVGAVVGFAWLPFEQPGQEFRGVWDAICSAAGLIRILPGHEQVIQADYPVTQFKMLPPIPRGARADAIGSGATLALRCTMCHGARGISSANTPSLAGQDPVVIYKQLLDFKTGARASAVMAPLVADLSDTDMRDLAAYYAYLPRASGDRAAEGEPPRIVADGAPMRNIAPCGACHGELASKAGAPRLGGQPEVYLHAQLEAFAAGTRHNDIGEQMRNVARGMTAQEIDAASRFYANRP
jgi:cytochrome c553